MGVADRIASHPRSIYDRTTWLVLNGEVTRMAQAPLYRYCRPADSVIDSKGPLSRTIAPGVLAELYAWTHDCMQHPISAQRRSFTRVAVTKIKTTKINSEGLFQLS